MMGHPTLRHPADELTPDAAYLNYACTPDSSTVIFLERVVLRRLHIIAGCRIRAEMLLAALHIGSVSFILDGQRPAQIHIQEPFHHLQD